MVFLWGESATTLRQDWTNTCVLEPCKNDASEREERKSPNPGKRSAKRSIRVYAANCDCVTCLSKIGIVWGECLCTSFPVSPWPISVVKSSSKVLCQTSPQPEADRKWVWSTHVRAPPDLCLRPCVCLQIDNVSGQAPSWDKVSGRYPSPIPLVPRNLNGEQRRYTMYLPDPLSQEGGFTRYIVNL